MLTQVFFFDYLPPPDFANDHNSEDPMVDDPSYMRFNLDKRCVQMQNYTNTLANLQMSKKNVMILMGDDFAGSNQYANFK